MSTTIRQQLMAAVMDHLGSFDRPAGIPAPVRTRVVSPKPSQLPVVTVYQAQETVDPMRDEKPGRSSRGAVVRRALDLKIEVLTKAVAGAASVADADADAILVWLGSAFVDLGRVVTVAAPRGLAHHQADEVGTLFEYEQGEFAFCRATIVFRFIYQSSSTNAAALA